MPSVLPDGRSGLHHYRQELVVQGPCTHSAMKPERRIYTYTVIMCYGMCMFRPARPTFIPVVSWSTVSHACFSMDPGAKALPLEIKHATLLRASQPTLVEWTSTDCRGYIWRVTWGSELHYEISLPARWSLSSMVARLFSSLPWLLPLCRREDLTESSPAMRQTWTSYICGDDFDLAPSRGGGRRAFVA